MDGASVESIFNRVRLNYPISRYVDILVYNGGMEILTRKNITKDEINVIRDWLDYYKCKDLRSCFYGVSTNNKYEKESIILKSMFKKYNSELDKNEHIYRGIRFKKDDEIFSIMVETYKQAYTEKSLIQIDEAPSSFSRDKIVAYNEFARVQDNEYNSLIFHLTKRTKGGVVYQRICR